MPDYGSLPGLPPLPAFDPSKDLPTGNVKSSDPSDSSFNLGNAIDGLTGEGIIPSIDTTKVASTGGIAGAVSNPGSAQFWTQLFLRTVIIVLGFIFVAAGLAMFNGKNVINIAGKVAKSVL